MKRLLVTISLIGVLLVGVFAGMFSIPYLPDKLANIVSSANEEIRELIEANWQLESELWLAEVNYHNQITYIETEKRKLKRDIWVLEEKYDNLQRMIDAVNHTYNLKMDEIQDNYEQEIYDQALKIAELERGMGRLNKELGKKLFDWFIGENPLSQDELIQFLTEDQTDKTLYDTKKEDWLCVEYTTLLMANAAAKGIRIYPTIVWFIDARTYTVIEGHTMNFAIVERALDDGAIVEAVYLIEPQSDQWWQFGVWRDKSTWKLPIKLFPFLP